jgi:hypothetical protein
MVGSIILVINWGNIKTDKLYYNVYYYKNKYTMKFIK